MSMSAAAACSTTSQAIELGTPATPHTTAPSAEVIVVVDVIGPVIVAVHVHVHDTLIVI